jgi:mRNA interferase MazF
MKRGDFYRVYKGNKYDPKSHRVFMVVSRQMLIDSQFSTVICAPIHSKYDGFPTQVEVGVEEGLKHDSAIYCDELVSFPKPMLTDYVGTLSDDKIELVNAALRIALAVG